MSNIPSNTKTLREKLDYLKEKMVDKIDKSDETLIYLLKGFAFDELAMTTAWNKAVANADLKSDQVFYERLGYIGFPIGKHIHKYFDCPIKAEKAWDDANEASGNAYVQILDEQFYDLIDMDVSFDDTAIH